MGEILIEKVKDLGSASTSSLAQIALEGLHPQTYGLFNELCSAGVAELRMFYDLVSALK